MPIGVHPDLQGEAARLLEEEGPMDPNELQDELGISHGEFQAVLRGLSDNGVLETVNEDSSDWGYDINEGAEIDQIYER